MKELQADKLEIERLKKEVSDLRKTLFREREDCLKRIYQPTEVHHHHHFEKQGSFPTEKCWRCGGTIITSPHYC